MTSKVIIESTPSHKPGSFYEMFVKGWTDDEMRVMERAEPTVFHTIIITTDATTRPPTLSIGAAKTKKYRNGPNSWVETAFNRF